jgi:hypothetical protein
LSSLVHGSENGSCLEVVGSDQAWALPLIAVAIEGFGFTYNQCMVPNVAGLEFAAPTVTGLVRTHNEDSVAISPAYGFAVLADGMGGYSAGEVASCIAMSVLKSLLKDGLGRL